MKIVPLVIIAIAGFSACAPVPSTPMDIAARRAAGAEITAKQCAGYAGGYEAVKDLRNDANRNMATAKQLGATSETIAQAKNDTQVRFDMLVAFTSTQEACNTMIGSLAWNDD